MCSLSRTDFNLKPPLQGEGDRVSGGGGIATQAQRAKLLQQLPIMQHLKPPLCKGRCHAVTEGLSPPARIAVGDSVRVPDAGEGLPILINLRYPIANLDVYT